MRNATTSRPYLIVLMAMLAMALALALGPIASYAQPVEEPVEEQVEEPVEEPVEPPEQPRVEQPEEQPEEPAVEPQTVEPVEPQLNGQEQDAVCHVPVDDPREAHIIIVAHPASEHGHYNGAHGGDFLVEAMVSPELASQLAGQPCGPALEPTTVEPTTVEPTTVEPTTPEPTTVEPTTPEPTTPEPTTPEPTATATATAPPGGTPSPTATATQPGEEPDGEAEVTGPDGEVTTITLYDLDVGDPPPLPGGPGGISRSEIQGEVAAAEALLAGEDFDGAVDAAEPYLDAEDSRDAARLMAPQLGETLPETGGPAALSIIAAMLLLGSGVFAWRLGVRGRWL